MPKNLILSNRLQMVAAFLPQGAIFVDIGSDHAYLPCYVCLNDSTAKAIAGEINEGPFHSAKETVTKYGLENVIDVRLGDGLQIIRNGEVNQVVIAGMGGALIKDILDTGKESLGDVERIIAQPNVDAKNVRSWVIRNGYQITAEEIVEENGHVYEIIIADKKDQARVLTEKELFFGPFLLKKRSSVFLQKWKHEKVKLERVLSQMKQAKLQNEEKIKQFEREWTWIKEVLQDGENYPE